MVQIRTKPNKTLDAQVLTTWLPLAVLILVLAAPRVARAAGITWGAAIAISGDTDVLTNGTFAYAYDWANNNQVVNGVSFTGSSSSTSGGVNVALSGFNNRNGTAFNSASNPFASLSTAYTNILVGAAYINGVIPVVVTLNNLTVGHLYAVQVWVNDPRGGSTATRTETITSSGGNTNTLLYDLTASAGGAGQYTIGTFTAGASSQSFTLTGNASTQ